MRTRSTITKLIAITMAVAAMAVIGSSLAAGRTGTAGRSDINDIYVSRSIIGITPEQSLRISVGSAANSIGDQADYTFTVTNTGGATLYESEWRYVPVRGFRCSHVSREDLNTEGEPGTRRAEVMVTVTLRVPAGSNPKYFPASLELVGDPNGSTILMSPSLVWYLRNSNTPG